MELTVDSTSTEEVTVDSGMEVEVAVNETVPSIEQTMEVTAEVRQWTLVSDAIYIEQNSASLPAWAEAYFNGLVETSQLNSDFTVLQQIVTEMDNYFSSEVSNLKAADYEQSVFLQGLKASTDAATSAIIDIQSTKVDAAGAYAQAEQAIGSWMTDGAGAAWVASKTNTMVTQIAASASQLNSLTVNLNGVSSSVTTNSDAIVTIDGYASAAYTLELDVNGKISGFKTQNDGVISTFDIVADKFKITNGASASVTPFEVDITDPQNPKILFNGMVEFSNLSGAPEPIKNLSTIDIGFLADHISFTGSNSGEFYLHGFIDGSPADVDGYLYYGGNPYTIKKNCVYIGTTFQGTTRYLVTRCDGGVWANNTASVIASYNNGSWLYDNNSTSEVLGTLQSDWFVIGTVSIGMDPDGGNGRVLPTIWGTPRRVSEITSEAGLNMALADMGNVTSIDGGKIATRSVTTDQLAIGTGIVNGYIQSSDFTAIGGAGFRLKSNAAAITSDPNIYGAYIAGGTIEGANLIGLTLSTGELRVAATGYPLNFGRTYYASTNNTTAQRSFAETTSLYSRSYGTGFNEKRICDINYSIVEILFTWTNGAASLQRSINGGAYSTVSYAGNSTFAVSTHSFIDTSLPQSFSTVRYKVLLTSLGDYYYIPVLKVSINNT